MARLKVNGVSLNENQIHFINKVIDGRGYTNKKISYEPALGHKNNVTRIIVTSEEKNFKMIAITTNNNELNTESFNNEIVYYDDVLNKLSNLQICGNVQKKNLLNYVKCYGSLKGVDEIILFDDLNDIELGTLDVYSEKSNDAITIIHKNFYILHSLISALRKNSFDLFDSFKSKLFEMWNSNADFKSEIDEEHSDFNYKSILKVKVKYFTNISTETDRFCRELFDKKGNYRNHIFEQRNWSFFEVTLESIQQHIRNMDVEFSADLTDFHQNLCVWDRQFPLIKALVEEYFDLERFLKSAVNHLKLQIDLLIEAFDEFEMKRRTNMLTIRGFKTEGDVKDGVLRLMKQIGLILPSKAIKFAVRKTGDDEEIVLIEFASAQYREQVWYSRLKLNGGVISEYLTKRRQRIYIEARKQISGVSTSNGVVTITGWHDNVYSVTSLQELNSILVLIKSKSSKGKSKQKTPRKLGDELDKLSGECGLDIVDNEDGEPTD